MSYGLSLFLQAFTNKLDYVYDLNTILSKNIKTLLQTFANNMY
jgi:hypothetical protein